MTSLVNKTNAHTGGFLSSNEGPVGGCTGKGMGVNGCGIKMYRGLVGQSGGKKKRRRSRKKRRVSKKRRKSRSKKRRRSTKKRRRRKHRGGATMEPMNPRAGLRAIATRGGNGSRGLSAAERRTLKGGNLTRFTKRQISKPHRLYGGGVGYGMTANDAATQAASGTPSGTGQGFHLQAGTSVTGYKNCGLIPSFKLGASSNFKGPADIQQGAGKSVNAYNQYSSAGYGYLHPTSAGNRYIAGYHAPITSTSKSQRCGNGGKRKKKGGRTRKRRGGNLKQLMSPLTDAYSRVTGGLHRAGNRVGSAFMVSDKMGGGGGCGTHKSKTHKKNKRKQKRGKSKKQKGGYAQYGSNVPLTRTLQLPAGSQGGSWEGQLATPPTYTAGNFCVDNYNHFTGKGSPSPVLDQAAPAATNVAIL
jgi:hypothetical protein